MSSTGDKIYSSWKVFGESIENLYRIRPIVADVPVPEGRGYKAEVEGFYRSSQIMAPDNSKIIVSNESYMGVLPFLSPKPPVCVYVIQPKTADRYSKELEYLNFSGYEIVFDSRCSNKQEYIWQKTVQVNNQNFLILSALADLMHNMNSKKWEQMPFIGESSSFSNQYFIDISRALVGHEVFAGVSGDAAQSKVCEFAYEWLKLAGLLVYNKKLVYDFKEDNQLSDAKKDFELLLNCLFLWCRELKKRGLMLYVAKTPEEQMDTICSLSECFGLQAKFDALYAGVPIQDLLP